MTGTGQQRGDVQLGESIIRARSIAQSSNGRTLRASRSFRKRCTLLSRKEKNRSADLLGVIEGMYIFEINSDVTFQGYIDGCEPSRLRQMELKSASLGEPGEGGLTMQPVLVLNRNRWAGPLLLSEKDIDRAKNFLFPGTEVHRSLVSLLFFSSSCFIAACRSSGLASSFASVARLSNSLLSPRFSIMSFLAPTSLLLL